MVRRADAKVMDLESKQRLKSIAKGDTYESAGSLGSLAKQEPENYLQTLGEKNLDSESEALLEKAKQFPGHKSAKIYYRENGKPLLVIINPDKLDENIAPKSKILPT